KANADSVSEQTASRGTDYELDLSATTEQGLARAEFHFERLTLPWTVEMFVTPRTYSRQSTAPANQDGTNRALFSLGNSAVVKLKQMDKVWNWSASPEGSTLVSASSGPITQL